MAEKRMFTMKIIDSDAFKEMPLSTQALYFHLGMNADDEGFLNNAKSVQRSISASDDDMKLLIAKKFIIPFESGVVVIKHWKMHNQIQPSRLKPTQYIEERNMLSVKENKSYTLNFNSVDKMSTECRQDVDKKPTRLGEIRLDKISIVGESSNEPIPIPQPKKSYGEYKNVLLTDEELENLKSEYIDYDKKIEKLSCYMQSTGRTYKDHYATIKDWALKDDSNNKSARKEPVPSWMCKSQDYDMDEIERKIVGNNPELSERAEALKKKLGGN